MPARVDGVTAGRGCAILNVDSGVWEEKAEGGVLEWLEGLQLERWRENKPATTHHRFLIKHRLYFIFL